jgi:molecular chaperone GrpE
MSMNDDEIKEKGDGGDSNSNFQIPNNKSQITNSNIEELILERDRNLEGWKRAKADYENLVRETNLKKTEYAEWATEQALSELLPALDQYDIAMKFTPLLESIPDDQRKIFQNWIVGLEAVRTLWWDAAKRLGLDRVKTDGTFDPALHEAVSEESNETVESGTIIRTMMSGYTLKGKLIRPAKVVVSK